MGIFEFLLALYSIVAGLGVVVIARSVGRTMEARIALQIVERRTEISDLGAWGDRAPRTQIIAIGKAINAQKLSKQFDACMEQCMPTDALRNSA